MLILFGVGALTLTVVAYAFERRHRGFVLVFAAGCALSSAYGFAAGVWPFGVVEAVWAAVALRRAAGAVTTSTSAAIACRRVKQVGNVRE